MDQQDNRIRMAVGVMTGTSIDGLDASLVEVRGHGLAMSTKRVKHASLPLGDLKGRLRAAATQHSMAAGELARLACEFGHLHADAIEYLLTAAAQTGPRAKLDLICVHGQTVFHQPPISWQLVNPAPIAQRHRCPVVCDLRQADLAAGGRGAPITPIADWILFRHESRRRAIINLGGYCNVTILPAGESAAAIHNIAGFDVCACNQILDAVARTALGVPFDDRGAAARQGEYHREAYESLLTVLQQQRSDRRSLGTGDEAMQWVSEFVRSLRPHDLAHNATLAIGECIRDAVVSHGVEEAIVAGGGARHELLLEALTRKGDLPIRTSDEVGLPIESRESVAFAVLGCLCADGVPITLPQVTGCRSPVPLAGSWTGLPSRDGFPN